MDGYARYVSPWRAMTAIVVVGAICCLVQYFWRASFWHDEAFLVLNIMDKTAAELVLGPLDHEQAAPPLFLLALRACYVWLGDSEFSLRLAPLLFALATLPVFAFLAWRVLGGWLAVWAMVLIALSDEMVFHAATVKQYSGDVFVASTLLAVALAASRPVSVVYRFLLVAFLSALAAWLSHPTIFIFGAISLAMLPELWRNSTKGRIFWIAGNLLVAGSFLQLYFKSIRLQHNPVLFQYWIERGAFPNYSKPWMLPVWLVDQLISVCNNPFQPMGGIVLLLALMGAVAWSREKQWKLLTATLGPIALTLMASLLMQFPFKGSRVTLFMTPGLVLLAARGIGMIRPIRFGARAGTFDWRDLLWIAPAALAGWCLALAAYHLVVPQRKSHMRPAMAYLKEHYRPGDRIYVVGVSRDYEFHCYWRNPPVAIVKEFDVSPNHSPSQPFWIVTGYNPAKGVRVISEQLELAHSIANETDGEIGIGGAAIRFEPKGK